MCMYTVVELKKIFSLTFSKNSGVGIIEPTAITLTVKPYASLQIEVYVVLAIVQCVCTGYRELLPTLDLIDS